MQTATDWSASNQREADIIHEIVTLGARIAAAEHMHIAKIRELHRIIHLSDCTYAQWISWRCHVQLKTAYELIRVGESLEKLPRIDQLFAEGRISYSKVRIVTRVADERTDDVYAYHALHCTCRQLENLVRHHRSVQPDEARLQNAKRYLSMTRHADGGFILRARIPAEQGAIILKALESAKNAGGTNDCAGHTNIDALVEICTAAIDAIATGEARKLHLDCHGASDVVAHAYAAGPRARAAANEDGDSRGASVASESGDFLDVETCSSIDGHAIAEHVAETLRCASRYPNARQRRALHRIHHGTCSHPRCTHRSFLHAHHIEFVSRGGKTALSNLTLLCSKHHRQLHAGEFTLERGANGDLVFKTSLGNVIPTSPGSVPVVSHDGTLASTVPATTDTSGRDIWDGTKPDYNESVGLLQTFDPSRQTFPF